MSMLSAQSVNPGAFIPVPDFNLGMTAFRIRRQQPFMILSRNEVIKNYKVLDLPIPYKFFAE